MRVEVTRGALVESVHQVRYAVSDAGGNGHCEGDVHSPVYLRSSAKPFQSMTVIAGGAANAWDLSESEIAVIAGSHHGEPFHVEAARSILAKAGVPESALKCGAHYPEDSDSAKALRQAGLEPTPIHSNCSGKHAGMLALAKHLGADLNTYLEPNHPVNRLFAKTMSVFCDIPEEQVVFGVDGCGLPAPAVSLREAAMAFARFASGCNLPSDYADAAARLRSAEQAHPEMVSGTTGFDTRVMRIAPHLLAKGGAEGVRCVANIATGEGLALKVDDGAARAGIPAAMALMAQLGWLSENDLATLDDLAHPKVRTVAGEVIGELRVATSDV